MSSPDDLISRKNLLLAGVVVTIGAIVWSSREQPVTAGSAVDFTITLVPADAKGLGCGSSGPLEGERCAFDDDGAEVKVDRPLRPYTTAGGEVILLVGVFEDANVAKWLDAAAKDKDDRRVTVRCNSTFLGKASSVNVRWAPTGSFESMEDLRIGRVKTCQVTPLPPPPK